MEYVMIRIALCLIAVLAFAIPAEAQCNGNSCNAVSAILHPFQTVGKVVRHPQRLPEGPPAASAVSAPPVIVTSTTTVSTATARQGRFHIFPIFQGRQARGGGGCGCGR